MRRNRPIIYLKLESPSRHVLALTVSLLAVAKARGCGGPVAAGESICVRGVGLQHTWDRLNCGVGERDAGQGYNRACGANAMPNSAILACIL